MQGHRVIYVVKPTVKAHSPYVTAAAAYSVQLVNYCAGVGARHHGPHGAIPMQRQSLTEESVVSHSPNVVSAAAHSRKEVAVRANGGAWHQGPSAAVPMHRQRPTRVFPHSPGIIGAATYCVQSRGGNHVGGCRSGRRDTVPAPDQ